MGFFEKNNTLYRCKISFFVQIGDHLANQFFDNQALKKFSILGSIFLLLTSARSVVIKEKITNW